MRIIKASLLAIVVIAFAGGSANAGCGGHQSQKTAQTTVTKTGPQTTVKQTAVKQTPVKRIGVEQVKLTVPKTR